jgi:hypothetical protein
MRLANKTILFEDQINDIETICPYCYNSVGNKLECCGESSAHFENIYVVGTQNYLVNDTIVMPRLPVGASNVQLSN